MLPSVVPLQACLMLPSVVPLQACLSEHNYYEMNKKIEFLVSHFYCIKKTQLHNAVGIDHLLTSFNISKPLIVLFF